MPFSIRRPKHPQQNLENVEVIGLARIDSVSSIASDATIDNQPGAGRTVGLLFSHLGSELEDLINERARRLGVGFNTPTCNLARIETATSIDSNATADNQPGAGRTVGLFFTWLGLKLEKAFNKGAERLGFGPLAIAGEIRYQAHTFRYCVVLPDRTLGKSDMKKLRKLCKKLIKYTRSRVIDTQFVALEEIINLALEDPLVRAVLANSDHNRLITHYVESDLLVATTKALGAIEFNNVHRVWAPVLSICVAHSTWFQFKYKTESLGGFEEWRAYDYLEDFEDDVFETIRDPSTSFLSARYFGRLVDELDPMVYQIPLHNFLARLRHHYTIFATQDPGSIEWSTFKSCTLLGSLNLTGTAFIHDAEIFLMAAILDPNVFIRHLSFYLVEAFPVSPSNEFCINNLGGLKPHTSTPETNTSRLHRFLSNITHSSDYREHLSCMDHLSADVMGHLKGTIFFNKTIFTYCVLICHSVGGRSNGPRVTEVNALMDMCTPLVSFMESDFPKENQLATALAAKFCTISRYCKLAALRAAQEISLGLYSLLSRNLAPTIAEVRETVASIDMIPESSPIALCRVLRFGFGGYNITQCSEEETGKDLLQMYSRMYPRQEVISIEQMFLGSNTTFISVDGETKPFVVTGHYPVLAFLSNGGPSKSFFIARVYDNRDYYYTYVEDGASSVTYQRQEYGGSQSEIKFKEACSSKFDVLALRYDPMDYRSGTTEGELKDPTGPLGWKEVYPELEVSLSDYLDWFP
ncbi:hypothetical protein SCHPADRAFT_947589 [Schizopora paradoxa]|uniref:Uncharacterized protein n=1 Tax=Schizopora paradoxa TaxID=27342 RepID=A0A0H2RIB8_9AGAM|nr:hypothetical protein SCHPADRAFT_947589 [Schizopora paradoxa]